jgi:lipopolysaccharide/colanic/teichoic acid biosynthesis glycosyltransferase
MRRVFDAIFAAVALVLLSPVLAIAALAIKLEDGGPVLFSQIRVGRNLHRFHLYKLRSMIPHAERVGCPLTEPGDKRITRVGAFLRKYKLDELPQLINVLRGDMRLVGSRPELESYVEMFRPQYAELLRERPGLTDPATLAYRHEENILKAGDVESHYVNQVLPHKLKISLEYSQRRTVFSDLQVILLTVFGWHQAAGNPKSGEALFSSKAQASKRQGEPHELPPSR